MEIQHGDEPITEDDMSNGPKMTLAPRLEITQKIGVYLAPLMTPVLRRSRDDRPVLADDDTPWRTKIARR